VVGRVVLFGVTDLLLLLDNSWVVEHLALCGSSENA
jgi:hypothetical protein